MNARTAITECVATLLDAEGRVTAERIVEKAYTSYPGVFADEAKVLARKAALRLAKDALRRLDEEEGEDDDQGQLNIGLPTAIAVPEKDGYVYVQSDRATWPDLLAGRDLRSSNVVHAQDRLDAYDRALRKLRPLMEADETVTVADALAKATP